MTQIKEMISEEVINKLMDKATNEVLEVKEPYMGFTPAKGEVLVELQEPVMVVKKVIELDDEANVKLQQEARKNKVDPTTIELVTKEVEKEVEASQRFAKVVARNPLDTEYAIGEIVVTNNGRYLKEFDIFGDKNLALIRTYDILGSIR